MFIFKLSKNNTMFTIKANEVEILRRKYIIEHHFINNQYNIFFLIILCLMYAYTLNMTQIIDFE